MAIFTRREIPPKFSNHRAYTPFLRRDFLFQCAYWERTETSLGGEEGFEVDHFRPSGKFPQLVCVYENLYYTCRACNGHKSGTWPTDDQISRGVRFADPCSDDLYVHHLREREDGAVEGLTDCGRYSSAHIRLDRRDLRTWRREFDHPAWPTSII